MVVQGSLFLVCHDMYNHVLSHIDIWRMNEYGDGELWTKLAKIPYPQEMHQSEHFWHFLCFSRNGKSLMATKKILVLYNSKEDAFQYLPIHVGELRLYDYIEFIRIITYVESLVSPYAMDHG
jgi:hypothetical protein